MSARAALLLCFFSDAYAGSAQLAQLPYEHVQEDDANNRAAILLERAETSTHSWRAQIGDRMYHAPSKESGLSRKITDYYVTLGNGVAMPEQMKMHRVGGQGRYHILHVPDGPSSLEDYSRLERHSAFSALFQLEDGMVLGEYPEFDFAKNYDSGLDDDMRQKERVAVDLLAPGDVHQTLKELVEIPSRTARNTEGQRKSIEFISKKFKEMKLKHGVHKFSDTQGNVVACIPGKTADSVTVGAHYDSRPFSGPAPGANDNGSGVAVMLNIAKALSKAKVVPTKTIYFVGFAAEEVGEQGSWAFANELKNKGGEGLPKACRPSNFLKSTSMMQLKDSVSLLQRSIRDGLRNTRRHELDEVETVVKHEGGIVKLDHKAIIMDEVGWKSEKSKRAIINIESRDEEINGDIMQHLAHACKEYSPKVMVVHNAAPYGSDHMSFLGNGMGAALLINGDDENYPCYHKSCDALDQTNSEMMDSIARMGVAATIRASGISSA